MARSRRMMSISRQLLLLCVVTLPLMSCREQDHLLMFECNRASVENISIESPASVLGGRQILVNKQQLALGTILRLSPSETVGQPGSESVAYRLTSSSDLHEFDRLDSWFATMATEHVGLARNAGRDAPVPDRVWLFFEEATRRVLRDPIAAINADKSAVAALRNGLPHSRFVIVSSVWLDDYVDAFIVFPPRQFHVNVFKEGRIYWHPTLDCAPLTMRSVDNAKRPVRSLLFAFTAVKYDPASRMVVLDGEPIDLLSFAFSDVVSEVVRH